MKLKIVIWAFLAAMTSLCACTTGENLQETPRKKVGELTALEVIEKNLDALGGEKKIQAVDTLMVKGAFGSALLPPSQEMTLYLKKPGLMKQEGTFSILLANAEGVVVNDGTTTRPITGADLDEIDYRIGFYHNCFSLLKWKEQFDTAELMAGKRYGAKEQHVIRLSGVEGGRDVLAYIDADTFLIDRLVYTIRHPDARMLKVVNQLREYKEFQGILMPTYIVYDKVGWETSPTHYVISDITVDPKIEDAMFESAEIDYGPLTVEGDSIKGKIIGQWSGSLLTNIRMEDFETAGIPMKSWLQLEVGSTRRKVQVLENIQTSAAEIKPGEVYLCQYPISGFPRFFLMGWNLDVTAMIPCRKGDDLVVTKTAVEDPVETTSES